MRWFKSKDVLPEKEKYVLCISKNYFGTFTPPFVCFYDGQGWCGGTNYRPKVDYWTDIERVDEDTL